MRRILEGMPRKLLKIGGANAWPGMLCARVLVDVGAGNFVVRSARQAEGKVYPANPQAHRLVLQSKPYDNRALHPEETRCVLGGREVMQSSMDAKDAGSAKCLVGIEQSIGQFNAVRMNVGSVSIRHCTDTTSW